MDLFYKADNHQPEKGDLLISEPFLPDPNFERTVILLCEHNENGSFGFVLNKKSEFNLDEVMEDVEDFQQPVYFGGPVQQDTLHFIHYGQHDLEGGQVVSNEIVWGGNYEQLFILINNGQLDAQKFKFFIGYSGWSPGQLEEELKQNSWIIFKSARKEDVFHPNPEQLWKEVMRKMGGKFKLMSNFPQDPRMN